MSIYVKLVVLLFILEVSLKDVVVKYSLLDWCFIAAYVILCLMYAFTMKIELPKKGRYF